jgi:hypothetical protein
MREAVGSFKKSYVVTKYKLFNELHISQRVLTGLLEAGAGGLEILL